VNQTHFNLLSAGKVRPTTITHHLESREAIVHDTIIGSESLEELKLHIPHRRPQFTIELGYLLLSRKRAIEAIESARFEDMSSVYSSSAASISFCASL
jgi:hypothetical protein